MEDLIVLVSKGKQVTEDSIKIELYEICNRVHSGCDDDCPVFRLNGSKIPGYEENEDCNCFKNGSKMLEFIRAH